MDINESPPEESKGFPTVGGDHKGNENILWTGEQIKNDKKVEEEKKRLDEIEDYLKPDK